MRWVRFRTRRARASALVAVGAVAGALLMIIPAMGQINEGDAVVFQLNGQGAPVFAYGGAEQPITTARNGCQITSAETLIDLAADGNKQPGLNGLSIGVKSTGSNANGTPCSQVDSTERLSVKPGPSLAGRAFAGVKLDLEMTGDAIVDITFLPAHSTLPSTYSLHTGTNFQALCSSNPAANGCPGNSDDNSSTPPYEIDSETGVVDNACAAPNSSGPNSGGNDNCIWRIDPGYDATEIQITVRNVGTVSLEAGVDTGSPSKFYLANAAPDAVNDATNVPEDATAPQSIDVLGNDTDPDGDDLVVTGVSAVSAVEGVPTGVAAYTASGVTFDPNGQFEYLDDGETATNTFTYSISDGLGGTDTATVTVTIDGANDLPVLADQVTVPEDATGDDAVVTLVTDVDDSDQDSLSFSCTPEDGTPDGVSLTDNGDGTATFSAPADFHDADGVEFDCEFSDGTANEQGQTVVVVTGAPDAPTAVDDVDYADDDEIVTIDVLGNDFDVDSATETLTITGVSNVPAGFTVNVAGDGSSISFQGPAEWGGSPVTFDYTIQDSTGLTDTGSVTVYEVIQCGETLELDEDGVTAKYTRLTPAGSAGCDIGKPYTLDLTTSGEGIPTVEFVPQQPGESDVEATFSAELSFGTKGKLAGVANTGTLEYDPNDLANPPGFGAMPWCTSATIGLVGDQRVVSSATLPAGETWCLAFVETGIASATDTRTTWFVYGIGDPLKRAS